MGRSERIIKIETIGERNGTGISPRNVGRCEASGKIQWRTEEDARTQAAIYAAAHGFKTGPDGAYPCPRCGFWHLRTPVRGVS